MKPLRVVVLISGRGSNMAALLGHSGPFQIVAVISNRPNAEGLKLAKTAAVPTCVVDHRDYSQRGDFEQELVKNIIKYQPDLIVLAGFMRILGASFVRRFTGQMINIHPSLLPAFPGLKTHERALQAGVQEHGASVHFVNQELDGGPIIAQIAFAVNADDTPQSLAARLLPLEHNLLCQVVKWYSEGRISYDRGKIRFDNQLLQQPLQISSPIGTANRAPGSPADPTVTVDCGNDNSDVSVNPGRR